MIIIGLAGAKGSGKTTVAGALTKQFEHNGYGVACASFADPIRVMIGALMVRAGINNPSDYLLGSASKNLPIAPLRNTTARKLMQTLGTDWGRKMVHEDLWTDLMKIQLDGLKEAGADVVIIDDVRFDSEMQLILDAGGLVYNIVTQRTKDQHDPHESEKGVIAPEIHNDHKPMEAAYQIAGEFF